MINEYQITIDSTDDISKMLSEAKRQGIIYDYYNACIYLRGASGTSIEVGKELRGLYVVATGPAVVHARENASIIAENSAVVHAHGRTYVKARERSQVYAHEESIVDLEEGAVAYVDSDDVEILANDDSRAYLPADGEPGAGACAEALDNAEIVRDGATLPN